ncbi:hypothetical protein [Halobacteriovorax marinus]|uniref:hypothetical protein n=1 Tax=Halobacteriovorax marinus TaxID=97084 RepID=UPI0002EB95AC|nr:hypothetical protein [Halobacteriovorax marinus]
MKKLALFLLILCSNSFGFGPVYDCQEDYFSGTVLLGKIPESVKIIDVYSVLSDFEKFNLFFDPKGSDLQFIPADGWTLGGGWDHNSDITAYQYKTSVGFLDRRSLSMKRLAGNLLEGRSRSEYFKNYPDVIFKSGDRVVRFRFNKVNYYNIFLPYYIKIKNYFKYGTINPRILKKNPDYGCYSPPKHLLLYDFVDE